jgi:hypothetical protein
MATMEGPRHINIGIVINWNYFYELMAILKWLVYGYR